MSTWYDVTEAREEWRDAAQLTDERLTDMLAAAKESVWGYGRSITLPDDTPVPDDIPAGWREAHLMQTRNMWNTFRTNPEGALGGVEFEVRPYPMDWMVRQLIRPLSIPRPY